MEQVRGSYRISRREFYWSQIVFKRGSGNPIEFKISSNLEEEKRTRLEEKNKTASGKYKTGAHVQGIENYLNYFYKEPESFIDFLEPGALIFIDEPSRECEKRQMLPFMNLRKIFRIS